MWLFHCFLLHLPHSQSPIPFSFFFFRQASQQDHPQAAFNLAVGKLKNMTGSLEAG
jgi:hypothetical protein